MSTLSESDHQLAMVPLFENLSPSVLDELARSSRVRHYPQGQILCNEGDPGGNLIVLEAGRLRISRLTVGGDEAVLAVIEPPAAVGELALLDGASRDATVIAQRAVTVRLIPRSVFLQLLKCEPSAVEGLLRTLAGLVRAGNARHAEFVGLDVPGRLARWLLRHAEKVSGGEVADGTMIMMHASQAELAAELGTTRSTLNRALHGFESLGLIAVDGTRITVNNPEKLVAYTW